MKKALLYAAAIILVGLMITHPVKDRAWPTNATNTSESAIDISGVIGQM